LDAALQWVPQPPQPSRANAKPQQRYILSAHVVLPTMETNKVVVVTATPLYAERPTWTGRRGISYVAAGRTMARMNCLRRSGRRKIYRSTASLWRNADAHSDRFCLLWLFVLEFFFFLLQSQNLLRDRTAGCRPVCRAWHYSELGQACIVF